MAFKYSPVFNKLYLLLTKLNLRFSNYYFRRKQIKKPFFPINSRWNAYLFLKNWWCACLGEKNCSVLLKDIKYSQMWMFQFGHTAQTATAQIPPNLLRSNHNYLPVI